MDERRLAPVYLFGIVFNALALVYAIATEEYLYASAFIFVIIYLSFRYRTL